MLKLEADVRGMDEHLRDLERMRQAGAHPSPFYGRAALRIQRDVIAHFSEQSGPEGHWARWSPAYAERRKRGRGGNKILVDTGTLRSSIQMTSDDRSAVVYSQVAYGAAHNYGMPERGLPQREFMYVKEPVLDDLERDWLTFIAGGR